MVRYIQCVVDKLLVRYRAPTKYKQIIRYIESVLNREVLRDIGNISYIFGIREIPE